MNGKYAAVVGTVAMALVVLVFIAQHGAGVPIMGLVVAMTLYNIGGLIGGRYSLTKSIRQNYETIKAGVPMPRLSYRLQSAAMWIAIGSALYYFVGTVGKRLLMLVVGMSFASLAIAGPPTHAYDVIGRTPVEIDARFSVNMDQAMRDRANFHVHNLNAEELGSLALLYRHSRGNTDGILRIMAASVDAEGLTRVAAAFGQEATIAAIKKYAKPSVALEFASLPMKPVITPSILKSMPSLGQISMSKGMYGGRMLLVVPPNTGMTIYEIYLSYRSAQMGSLSVGAAITEAGIFAAGDLMLASAAGESVGWCFNAWLNSTFPDVTPAIGDAIGNIVDHLASAYANGILAPTVPNMGSLSYGLNREIYQLADEGSGMPWLSLGDWSTYSDGAWYYFDMTSGTCEGTDSCIQPY
jgi:hypothetical protein